MAIKPSIFYAGQTDTTDPVGYPYGAAQNSASLGDGIGTPLEKTWVNDVWGFLQALLAKAGIAPSGTPDKVGASDYLSALQNIAGRTNQLKNWRMVAWNFLPSTLTGNNGMIWVPDVPLATLMEPPIVRMMEPGGELNDRRKWCHASGRESSTVRGERVCGGGAAAWV